ncbi:MAG: RluA family pseudouridine synthase [Spirochaetaceae bacterium]|jgi:23S rRNA pseudouridine955/2504/2580 synthase|nr:RluA family pseudouridine synthase [Spirochaetaceae bacterium]
MKAQKNDDGRRLDRIVRKVYPNLPLSAVYKLFRSKKITVNGEPFPPGAHVYEGDEILVLTSCDLAPAAASREEAKTGAKNKAPPSGRRSVYKKLNVILETKDLLFVNKNPSQNVHGGESLTSFVLEYLRDKTAPSLSFTPGPLHRLDFETSGAVAFSKTLAGAREFSDSLKKKHIKKTYICILQGVLKKKTVWRDLLVRDKNQKKTFFDNDAASLTAPDYKTGTGKFALSAALPLALSKDGSFTLAAVRIYTGRTHQIRAQAARRGLPLAGDKKYGGDNLRLQKSKTLNPPFFLHAASMEIPASLLKDPPKSPKNEPFDASIIEAQAPSGFVTAVKALFPGFETECFLEKQVFNQRFL